MPAKESKPAPPKAASKGAAKPAKPAKPAAPKAASKGVVKPTSKKVASKVKVPAGKASAGKGKVAVGGKGRTVASRKAPSQEESTNGSKFKALFHQRPKNYSIGNDIQPRRDLTRYVRWPRYIRIAKQKRILQSRLKIPPALHQFSKILDKNATDALYKLARKYRTEEPQAKRKRLLKIAEVIAKGRVPDSLKKPMSVTQGIAQVSKAIARKKAKLVVVAGDVEPIELVVAIPALCRKLDVPYVIVRSKARLGTIVNRKWTTCIAFTDARKDDKSSLANLVVIARETFNDNIEHRRQWGGGKLGQKSAAVIAKRQRIIAKELAARTKA